MDRDVFLIRHTPVAGMEGICYGRTEAALSPDFPSEARRIGAVLAPFAPLAWFSSPSLRCARLAEALGGGVFTVFEDLMELDFGIWENRPWNSLPRAEVDAWAGDFVHRPCPGGESMQQLSERVWRFWEGVMADGPARIAVVAHGGPIRALLSRLQGRPPEDAFDLRVDPGSIHHVEFRAGRMSVRALPAHPLSPAS